MNNRPLYENLDTAFVNLSALVKYLRHREFIGHIRVELNSYEADIMLLEGNKISVSEHDKISGRRADGEEAFQRLIIRSREAGGTIHVYQTVKQTAAAVSKQAAPTVKNEFPPPKDEIPQIPAAPKTSPVVRSANLKSAVPVVPSTAVKVLPAERLEKKLLERSR